MEPVQELESLRKRVQVLERQNRLVRRGILGIVLAAGCVLVMGQARPSRTVSADQFTLTDSAGRPRAILSIANGGPTLAFYGPDGPTELLELAADQDGGDLVLADAKSEPRIGLFAARGRSAEPAISIYKLNGSEVDLASTPAGVQRAAIPASPRNEIYAGVGGGHWISEVSGDGGFITLEDGSVWDVNPADRVDTALWLPVTDITVLESRSPVGDYRYELIDKDDGERALVKYLGKE